MNDMTSSICGKLSEIESIENVRIIAAVESGSRAWGFASPDSDYDVRFIYVRKRDEYLRLDRIRDVIEWQLDEVYDINGWDLQKTLILLHDSNPTVFEWCASPIVYRSSQDFESLKEISIRYFSPKKSLHHYLHMAERNFRDSLQAPQARVKKYFYVLRPLLAAKWVVDKELPPPMLFSELAEAELDAELRPEVERLLVMKREVPETEMIPVIPVLYDYVERNLDWLEEIASQMPSRRTQWEPLNEFFREMTDW